MTLRHRPFFLHTPLTLYVPAQPSGTVMRSDLNFNSDFGLRLP